MTDTIGTDERPLRVAIVGSGPSGFYAADSLFSAGIPVRVDVFDRLPAPYGLVRYGVAPDHQKIKNVIKVYERIAQQEAFTFWGNVNVGTDISVEELRQYFDAVIFACGAQTDRALGIPGEELPGSYTATEFVAWYNGHPDYVDREFDLSCESAVVIGQGNVAVDVCRILCKTVEELKTTDIAKHALDALAQSRIKEVHMIGRRGPVQAAFTPPEIREFGNLAECDPVVNKLDLIVNEASQQELDDTSSPKRKKNFEILTQFANLPPPIKLKRFHLHFYRSPKALKGDGHVQTLVLEKNELSGLPGQQKATGTGETIEIPCGIFFRSVGYRGVAIPGVPFDDRKGVFPNQDGRVTDGNGQVLPGLYAAGWIKRGPSGVIGTNKPDSEATVKNLLADRERLTPCPRPDSGELKQCLAAKGVKMVSFTDWKRIDAAETEQGQAQGKPREKFVSVKDMLAVLSKTD